jgi:hypothetical protein
LKGHERVWSQNIFADLHATAAAAAAAADMLVVVVVVVVVAVSLVVKLS